MVFFFMFYEEAAFGIKNYISRQRYGSEMLCVLRWGFSLRVTPFKGAEGQTS